jgi:hypothetical protein
VWEYYCFHESHTIFCINFDLLHLKQNQLPACSYSISYKLYLFVSVSLTFAECLNVVCFIYKCAWLKSHPRNQLFLCFFLSAFRQLSGWCLKIGHDCFLPHLFQFIINDHTAIWHKSQPRTQKIYHTYCWPWRALASSQVVGSVTHKLMHKQN